MLIKNNKKDLNLFVSNNPKIFLNEFYYLFSDGYQDKETLSFLKIFEINNTNIYLEYLINKNNNLNHKIKLDLNLILDYMNKNIMSFLLKNINNFFIYLYKKKYIDLSTKKIKELKTNYLNLSKSFYNNLTNIYLNYEEIFEEQNYKYYYHHKTNNKEYKLNKLESFVLEDVLENKELLLDIEFVDFLYKLILINKNVKLYNTINDYLLDNKMNLNNYSNLIFFNNYLVNPNDFKLKQDFNLDLDLVNIMIKKNSSLNRLYFALNNLPFELKIKNIKNYMLFLIYYINKLEDEHKKEHKREVLNNIKFLFITFINVHKTDSINFTKEISYILFELFNNNIINLIFDNKELFSLLYYNIEDSFEKKSLCDDIIVLKNFHMLKIYNKSNDMLIKIINLDKKEYYKVYNMFSTIFMNIKNDKNNLKNITKLELFYYKLNQNHLDYFLSCLQKNFSIHDINEYLINIKNLYQFYDKKELLNIYYDYLSKLFSNEDYENISLMLLNIKKQSQIK